MNKPKYNLSKEAVDRLMKNLEQIAYENLHNVENEDIEVNEVQISTDFIKAITKVKGLDDVIRRNEQLTKSFRGFIDMYGFETMYDMYVYAMSCDTIQEEVKKGQSKDYSRLIPVKRKIVRNGKEYEVTIWESPDKGNENKEQEREENSNNKQTTNRRIRRARELDLSILEDDEVKNPKKVAELKVEAKKMRRGGPFKDTSDNYIIFKDGKDICGIVGYSDIDGYLTMDFYLSNKEVSGVAARGFFEILKKANELGKGVKMDDIPEARWVYMQSGLEQQKDGKWVIESDTLNELMSFGTEKG